MSRPLRTVAWLLVALVGAFAVGSVAIKRGENISSLWLLLAAVCTFAIAYRFYAKWIALHVLLIDPARATPAERLSDGLDFVPTHRWIVFGSHFSAIAGPGPLVGPTLAAQFGYLPGTIWILVGAVLGGCVQDLVILFASTRRNGKSLGQMIREEMGPVGGFAALIGTLAIMIVLISVLGLVVVKAMRHSPWGTFTVAATIPIAMLVGCYLRYLRPGRVLEAAVIGVALSLAAVVAGQYVHENPAWSRWFDHDGLPLAFAVMAYGLAASITPVWLILAPRGCISTFLKVGTVALLAVAIVILHPDLHLPALTRFTDGHGPIFAGGIFPFVFITIACGAISGFHSLIASGTTPKLIANESDIPVVGYGAMLLEAGVAIMAMIAAAVLQPGVFFAINSGAASVGETLGQATATITGWGFPVTAETMNDLARQMGESTLLARTGGAPSLAVGMASIFGNLFGDHLLALWYHFAIMFEAVFILTTVDAGTRVGRFMLQDLMGNLVPRLGRTSWYPGILLASALIVSGWGYFLYIGVIDPNGGVNILWPLFGISNQMLAAIALSLATVVLLRGGREQYLWITLLPLAFLLAVTTTAACEKLFSEDAAIGFFAAARGWDIKAANGVALAEIMAFNQRLVGWVTAFFLALLWTIVGNLVWVLVRHAKGDHPASTEAPYAPTRLTPEMIAVGAAGLAH